MLLVLACSVSRPVTSRQVVHQIERRQFVQHRRVLAVQKHLLRSFLDDGTDLQVSIVERLLSERSAAGATPDRRTSFSFRVARQFWLEGDQRGGA